MVLRVVILSLMGACNLSAQQPVTKLLTFDIAAIDKRGTLISDLQAYDFRITDAGRIQQIAYFRRGQDVTPPDVALDRGQSNHTYASFPHVMVVVLDQLNAKVDMSGTEWQEIGRGLGRAETESELYFYLLTEKGTLFPIRGLPDSWMEAAAGRFRVSDVLPLFEDMRRQVRARPGDLDVSRSTPGDANFDRVMKRKQMYTETALQQLATRLSSTPGPKSILWIGPKSGRPFRGDPAGRIRSEWGESPDPVPVYYVGTYPPAVFTGNPNGPGPIARRVDQMLALIMSDSQRGYRIGYYPPAESWDGRHHDLHIICTRHGITVRAKAGYTAVLPVDVEDDRRQGIPDLPTVSLLDTSTIRFRAEQISPSPVPQFDLRVNAEDILFQGSAEASTCSLAVQAFNYGDGEELDVLQDPLLVDLRFTAAERQIAVRDGISIRLAVAGSNDTMRYRIVILDRATQSFGTLTIQAGSKHQ